MFSSSMLLPACPPPVWLFHNPGLTDLSSWDRILGLKCEGPSWRRPHRFKTPGDQWQPLLLQAWPPAFFPQLCLAVLSVSSLLTGTFGNPKRAEHVGSVSLPLPPA